MKEFEQAIALDSKYALPWAGLGVTYQVLDDWVLPPREVVPKARTALERALDLDPSLSEAHTQLGNIHFWYDFDQAAAEKEYRRALELNPASDDAHTFYGWYLVSNKRCDEGLAEHRRAIELSPFDPNDQVVLAQSLYYCHHYDEAEQVLRTMVAANPNVWLAHELLGWVYAEKNDIPRSVVAIQKAVAAEPNIAEPLAALGWAYVVEGDRKMASAVLAQLKQRAARGHVPPYDLALIYAASGDREQAVKQLQNAYDERSWFVTFLGLDPKLDSVRSDPRVQQILRQAGLP